MPQAPMTGDTIGTSRGTVSGSIALGVLRLMLFGFVAALVFTLGRVAWIMVGA